MADTKALMNMSTIKNSPKLPSQSHSFLKSIKGLIGLGKDDSKFTIFKFIFSFWVSLRGVV